MYTSIFVGACFFPPLVFLCIPSQYHVVLITTCGKMTLPFFIILKIILDILGSLFFQMNFKSSSSSSNETPCCLIETPCCSSNCISYIDSLEKTLSLLIHEYSISVLFISFIYFIKVL